MTEVTMTRSQFKDFWHSFLVGVANDLANALARRAPVDTGFLRNSIRYRVKGLRTVEVVMPKYALYVEFGTPPHIIRPKNAKMLHFKVGKEDVFARQVNHPGTRPQPFIRTTLREDLPKIIRDNIQRRVKT